MGKLIKFLVVLVIIGAGLFYGLQLAAGYATKTAVEQAAAGMSGATVTVESATVSLIDGTVSLNGVVMKDLEGFGPGDTVDLKSVTVAVDPESLGGDMLTLRALTVDSPVMAYTVPEGVGDLRPLVAKMQSQARQLGGAARLGSGGGGGLAGALPQVSIGALNVTNGQVNIQVAGQTVSVPIPDMAVDPVGGSGGIPVQQLAQQVMRQVMAGGASALAGADLDALMAQAGAAGASGGSGQLDAARRALESMGGEAENTLRQLMDQ